MKTNLNYALAVVVLTWCAFASPLMAGSDTPSAPVPPVAANAELPPLDQESKKGELASEYTTDWTRLNPVIDPSKRKAPSNGPKVSVSLKPLPWVWREQDASINFALKWKW